MRAGRILLVAALLAIANVAVAAPTTLTFTPDPDNMYDLDHHSVYMWGMDVPLDPGEYVISASLSFYNIRNWDNNSNTLYVHQLNWAELGLHQVTDNEGGGDYFSSASAANATHLVTYTNLPTYPQDLTYDYTDADLATLNSYLADGRYGLGIDPDCHYYNDGVELSLTIVPEPASLVLLAAGAALLVGRRR